MASVIVYDEVAEITPEQFSYLVTRPIGVAYAERVDRQILWEVLRMVVFTGPDKSLLDRAARSFDAQAAALNWEGVTDLKKRKAVKLEFDRLKRDAFDLRALGIRLKKMAKVLASQQAAKADPAPQPTP